MRIASLLLLALALTGCNRSSATSEDIIGHRWAHALADCGETYLDFSQDSIEFVRDGDMVNRLAVRRIVTDTAEPSTVMFVIEVDGAFVTRPVVPAGAADVAMLFKVEGDGMRLVGQGTPEKLQRVTMGEHNFGTFSLRRCPS